MNPQGEVSLRDGSPVLNGAGEQQSSVAHWGGTGDVFQRSRFFSERGLASGRYIHRTRRRKLRAIQGPDLEARIDLSHLGGPAYLGFDFKTAAPAYVAAQGQPAQL